MINHNKPGKKPNEFGLSDEELIVYQQQVEAVILENQRKMKELLSSKDKKMVAIDGDLVVKQLKEKDLPQTLAEGIILDKFLEAVQMQRDILLESNLNIPLSYGYRDYALQ